MVSAMPGFISPAIVGALTLNNVKFCFKFKIQIDFFVVLANYRSMANSLFHISSNVNINGDDLRLVRRIRSPVLEFTYKAFGT